MIEISLTRYRTDCADSGLSLYGNLQANAQIIYGAYHAEWVKDSNGVTSLLRLEMFPRPEDIRR